MLRSLLIEIFYSLPTTRHLRRALLSGNYAELTKNTGKRDPTICGAFLFYLSILHRQKSLKMR
jgi:hypothetical protein